MKRALKRRMEDARMPGPVFRDVHPDREPVGFYYHDGTVAIETDLPASLMRACRAQAKKIGTSPAELLVTILQDHADRRERGF